MRDWKQDAAEYGYLHRSDLKAHRAWLAAKRVTDTGPGRPGNAGNPAITNRRQWATHAGVDESTVRADLRRWDELAAGVWAFTGGDSPHYSFRGLARLGMRGLRDKAEVSKYHHAWQYAIDNGHAEPVEPGDIVELPTIDFSVCQRWLC